MQVNEKIDVRNSESRMKSLWKLRKASNKLSSSFQAVHRDDAMPYKHVDKSVMPAMGTYKPQY